MDLLFDPGHFGIEIKCKKFRFYIALCVGLKDSKVFVDIMCQLGDKWQTSWMTVGFGDTFVMIKVKSIIPDLTCSMLPFKWGILIVGGIEINKRGFQVVSFRDFWLIKLSRSTLDW